VRAQQVIVSDDASYTTPANGAMLDVKSTTKGFIVPRMTTAQRTTLGGTTPANGVVVYDTELTSFWYWETNAWLQIAASGINLSGIKFGDASNYSTFEADGTLLMVGNATVWDDIRVSLISRGTSSSPTFSQIQGNLYAYKFNGTADNSLYFEIQMTHSWKEGTTIYPHVHWASNGTSTGAVIWGLDYEWKNINETFSGTTANISTSIAAVGIQKNQQITNIGASGITESDKKISSIILCRLYRAGNTDANNDDCFLLSFDIHYEVNTIGSRGIITK
jgi:hypothetical protein